MASDAGEVALVSVRLFASAREAAGTPDARVSAATVADVTAQLEERFGTGFARVLRASTLLVAGERLAPTSDRPLPDGALVDVLPPFAGG